ncbi:MAG: iron-sulfur cluster-binding domain-containing protein [Eubacteriales bacterium]|nr:iron-sulfur cluster-binding domain-containing protein [Eubacteriales bacterium]
MAKYNYDRKGLKGLTPFPFLGEVKTRTAAIESAPDTVPNSIFNPNILSARLHPDVQHCIISKVEDHGDAKSFTLVPDAEKGTTEMAYFRASQYVSVALNINGHLLCKPYTIRSNPKDALGTENTSYTLTIKTVSPGFASPWILANWKEGDKVDISGPLGNFYYQDLKDAKNVIALAGGSGITPFYSMAAAIVDGIEDFNLTIIYGSRRSDGILLKKEIEELADRSNGKVKVVHVLSEEQKEGYEYGFITADLIKKYAPDGDYSVFMCGPKAMYKFCEGECVKLGLPKRRYRSEMSGDYMNAVNNPDYPKDQIGKEYKLTVVIHGEKQTIPCKAGESLIWAIEAAGIFLQTDCRSGICGWCHSRLISGNVYVPADADGRRLADKKFGWIHPCASFPLSDIELEVFPV